MKCLYLRKNFFTAMISVISNFTTSTTINVIILKCVTIDVKTIEIHIVTNIV